MTILEIWIPFMCYSPMVAQLIALPHYFIGKSSSETFVAGGGKAIVDDGACFSYFSSITLQTSARNQRRSP